MVCQAQPQDDALPPYQKTAVSPCESDVGVKDVLVRVSLGMLWNPSSPLFFLFLFLKKANRLGRAVVNPSPNEA